MAFLQPKSIALSPEITRAWGTVALLCVGVIILLPILLLFPSTESQPNTAQLTAQKSQGQSQNILVGVANEVGKEVGKWIAVAVLIPTLTGLSGWILLRVGVNVGVSTGISKGEQEGFRLGIEQIMKKLKPTPPRPGCRKNAVLVVGLGRCGKSTLVQAMTQPFNPSKVLRTKNFVMHHTLYSNQQPTDFYFTDYEGQDLGQLISCFVAFQSDPTFPMKYGDVNSLILVVDLFGDDNADEKKYAEPDDDNIQEHLTQWNQTALDAVFGLVTRNELKYVCLFINKLDKWTRGNEKNSGAAIRRMYAPLIKELNNRTLNEDGISHYAHFDVIIGSAMTGAGVGGISMGKDGGGLLTKLYQYAMTAPPSDQA